MTQQDFPQLSNKPMIGDTDLLQQSLAAREQREGRRGTKRKHDTSIFTRAVQEVSEFGENLRLEFRKDIPAAMMKRRLTRAQVKERLIRMSPEERMAKAREWGRPFIELAAQIMGDSE